MLAYEVLLNGERLCIAGIGDEGVLDAMVTWVGRANAQTDAPHLSIGGICGDEHVRWDAPGEEKKYRPYPLAVGDEVTIRVVEVDAAVIDEPTRAYAKGSKRPQLPRVSEQLGAARAQLPFDAERASRQWSLYETYVANHSYRDALFFLADLGEVQTAPPRFWRKLLTASVLLFDVASKASEA